MPFSIGEFSRMTSLSIKTLRLYHEKGILVPSVDEFTGYRRYSESDYEIAKSVRILKQFDFSLAEIKEILDEYEDETDILDHLRCKLDDVQQKIRCYAEVSRSIETLIQSEKESAMKNEHAFTIEEKELDNLLIAGMRMRGCYGDCGKAFGQIARKMGPAVNGKAMILFYDTEFKEEDADFEPCFPVRKGKDAEGIFVRELKGGKAVTLIHKGPYGTQGDSYKKIFAYINAKGYKPLMPSREVYLKGPGMILKGNPDNYLTEIQVLVEA